MLQRPLPPWPLCKHPSKNARISFQEARKYLQVLRTHERKKGKEKGGKRKGQGKGWKKPQKRDVEVSGNQAEHIVFWNLRALGQGHVLPGEGSGRRGAKGRNFMRAWGLKSRTPTYNGIFQP